MSDKSLPIPTSKFAEFLEIKRPSLTVPADHAGNPAGWAAPLLPDGVTARNASKGAVILFRGERMALLSVTGLGALAPERAKELLAARVENAFEHWPVPSRPLPQADPI